MKIGFPVEFYKPVISGVVTSVDTLADYLQKIGCTVFCIAPRVLLYKDRSSFKVVRVLSVGFLTGALSIPVCTRFVVKKIESLQLDLIHLQAAYLLGILCIKIGRLLQIPVIMTCHTDIVTSWDFALGRLRPFLGWIVRKFALKLTLYLFTNTAKIIVPSHYTLESLASYGVPPEKLVVIPTAVEAPPHLPSRSTARTRLGLPQDKLILTSVGRMSTDKNPDLLIEVFRRIRQVRNDVILILVGGGLYGLKIRLKVWLKGLSGDVILTGPVPYEEVWDYYAACDIFVFAGAVESQGLTPQEALAAGRPVVAIDSGGVKEFVKHGRHGFLVRSDPDEFAGAVLHLIDDSELRHCLGALGAEDMEREMSPEVVYPPLLDLYKDVIARTRQSVLV